MPRPNIRRPKFRLGDSVWDGKEMTSEFTITSIIIDRENEYRYSYDIDGAPISEAYLKLKGTRKNCTLQRLITESSCYWCNSFGLVNEKPGEETVRNFGYKY